MTSTKPSLSVIIVTFNNADTIQSCLSSISHSVKEVVVIDNASQDDTCEKVMSAHPNVTLLKSSSNTGFAAAVNHGVSKSQGDLLLLLNPDTVLGHDCIAQMLDVAQQAPQHGIYGGNATYLNGRSNRLSGLNRPTVRSVLSGAIGLRALFPGSSFFDPEAVWKQLEKSRADAISVDIVSGACLMTTRSLWDRLGGFDLRYFMYGEDADLCIRAQQLGYDPAIIRKAGLVHHVGGSATSSTTTQLYLLSSKITVAHDHGPTSLRWFGGLLFRLHVLSRIGGAGVFSALKGFHKSAQTDWRKIWRTRAVWLHGYPEHHVELPFGDE